MIIKRYIVDNMNEAMTKIRYELGNDAVIVSQRKIRQKGITGLFKNKKIEVTAAVDEKAKKPREVQSRDDNLKKEIDELKNMVQVIANKNASPTEKKKDGSRNKLKQKLTERDIPEEVIEDIYNIIKTRNGDKKLSPKASEKEIVEIINDIIKVEDSFNGRVHVFLGPTGVGKTTTIAKLASTCTLYKEKKVGLITLDTYRIGAVEQLKTYAEILGVPFGVIISIKDVPEVMEKMKDRDIIFIDTTGRNSNNMMQVSEIKTYINELNADSVHLVLSMTTKNKDIKKIIDNYKQVDYTSIILTKMDETEIFGSILTSVYYSKVPVSYITTGQNVPEDIEEVDKEKLIKLILGAEG